MLAMASWLLHAWCRLIDKICVQNTFVAELGGAGVSHEAKETPAARASLCSACAAPRAVPGDADSKTGPALSCK